MSYASGADFRRALEDRLRTRWLSTGTPLVRLRKMIAFDRFLARLMAYDAEGWLVKGGFALQLRFGDKSRTTKDLDLLLREAGEATWDLLRDEASRDLGDWFQFEVARPIPLSDEDQPGGQRFTIRALLDGREFEEFHVDVGTGDPVVEAPDILLTPDLLHFAGIERVAVTAYPLTQQVAEKLHAYSRPYGGQRSSRVRDFVDLLLIASEVELDGQSLAEAIEATFEARTTHPIPQALPDPPGRWAAPFRRLMGELDLDWEHLDLATRAAQDFINPVLAERTLGKWNPSKWAWV